MTKNNTWCVYKHTNKINGKIYIGITIYGENPNTRWANGLGYRNNKYFINAIEKYNWDNFTHEILFNNLTKDEACEKEIKLIALYDATNREKGYNISIGGSAPMCGRKHTKEAIKKIRKNHKSKKVNQYDLDGNFIKSYYSVNEASRELNIEKNCSSISDVCNRKKRSVKNFQFRFYDDCDDISPIDLRINKTSKTVLQFDLMGNFIKSFKSITICSKELNIDKSNIFSCCENINNQTKEYIFLYEEDSSSILDRVKKLKHNLVIYQIDKNNNIIKKFKNTCIASNELEIGRSSITNTCLSRTKHTHGLLFCYEKDYITK